MLESTEKSLSSDNDKLKRGLSNRHIQLIAIGGAIGTGLFMGSGNAIHTAGPSIIFIYAITGFMLFFVMRAMGELLLSNLKYKSFLDFTDDYLGHWVGFIIGWTYWLCWIVTCTAEVVAICHYTSFWLPGLHALYPAFGAILFLALLNYIDVKFFGEVEFWFTLIKIIAIFCIIVIACYLIYRNFSVPNSDISLWNVWNNGNLLPNGYVGFFKGFQITVFSFVGIELAGTTAAEVENPTRNLPKAINSIPWRILFCYLLSLLAIIEVTPWEKILPDQSPFVFMFVAVGLPIGANIINFVVLLSALSSANSGIFSTSRMLFGLAKLNKAPVFLGKLARHRVPVNSLIVSCSCLILTYLTIHFIPSMMDAFTVITSVSAILFLLVWSLILFSYIAYRIKKPDLHNYSIYKLPGGIATCVIVLLFFVFILAVLTLDPHTKIALFVAPIWLIVLNIMYFIHKKLMR